MKTVRLAMIGLGSICEEHARVALALPGVKLVAGVRRDERRGRAFCKKHRIEHFFTSTRKLIDWGEFDAAIVAPSHLATVEVSRLLLDRGWPCLIEKPVGFSAKETASLGTLARRRKTWGMVGVNRRFYSNVHAAMKLIRAAGGLKSIVVEAPERIHQSTSWGLSGKVLDRWFFVNGIHMLDLMFHLVGMPRKIHAIHRAGAARRHAYDALLEFSGKVVGHYTSQWYAPGSWSLTLYAKNLRIRFDPMEEVKVYRTGMPPEVIYMTEMDRKFKPGFHLQLQSFVAGVRSGDAPSSPSCLLDAATQVMQMMEAIANPPLIKQGKLFR